MLDDFLGLHGSHGAAACASTWRPRQRQRGGLYTARRGKATGRALCNGIGPPLVRLARSSSAIRGQLDGPFDRGQGGPGGWIILDEPELHLGEDVLVHDLAGWRRTTLPELPDDAFLTVRPDWVAEVLSPSTQRKDRTLKGATQSAARDRPRLARRPDGTNRGSVSVACGRLSSRRQLWR